MKTIIRVIGAIGAATVLSWAHGASAQQQFVTVGTGGVTGVYYPVGGAICRLVNANRETSKIRCAVESTAGSVFNVNALKRGDLTFAVVQSDFQAYALNGSAAFEGKPFKGIRALFSLHGEPAHLMARADAGIDNLKGLKGKRVNIGNPGSGHRVMMELIMKQAGLKSGDFALVSELRPAEQAAALCDNRIDAAFWAAGVPNGSAQEASSTCAIKMVPLKGRWLKSFMKEYPFYADDQILAGSYPGTDSNVPTFGARATFVTRADVPEKVVYEVVKAVFDSFDDFKQLHPALSKLKPAAVISAGLTAPLHPGAVRYYKEKGLM